MNNRKYIIPFIFAAILGASCSKDNGEDKDQGVTGDNTQVTVAPDRERILLKNPLSGWVTYSGIGSGLADNYWDFYDNLPCADAPDGSGQVSVWDYSNVLYIKADWADMNPEDGVYIWEEQYQDYSDFGT